MNLPFVSFRYTHTFLAGGAIVTSDSTLRFRSREELHSSLAAQDHQVPEVREASGRPGHEFVFITRRTTWPNPAIGTLFATYTFPGRAEHPDR